MSQGHDRIGISSRLLRLSIQAVLAETEGESYEQEKRWIYTSGGIGI